MNEQKAVRPGSAWRKPVRSESPARQPPEATMQTHAAIRKAGGRLSREDQRRLGDILQRVYDDVIHQGVPDRFKDLLTELDQPGDKLSGEAATSSAPAAESDRLLAAKASDNKGSHS